MVHRGITSFHDIHLSFTMRTLVTIGLILVLTTSCHEKFDSKKWRREEDLRTHPFREAMIADIVDNKKFIGQTFKQVLDSLGKPNSSGDGKVSYSIITDYGRDIDPIYTKDLVLTLDKDSLVTDVKIEEWKK